MKVTKTGPEILHVFNGLYVVDMDFSSKQDLFLSIAKYQVMVIRRGTKVIKSLPAVHDDPLVSTAISVIKDKKKYYRGYR